MEEIIRKAKDADRKDQVKRGPEGLHREGVGPQDQEEPGRGTQDQPLQEHRGDQVAL